MSDLQNSPYFLSHEGVKGRSGKPGAGLWYRNGKLTPEGYEHYYGQRTSRPGLLTRYKRGRELSKEKTKIQNEEYERQKKRSKEYQEYSRESERLLNKYNLDADDGGGGDSTRFSKQQLENASRRYWENQENMDSLNDKFNENAKKYADNKIVKKYGKTAISDIEHYDKVNGAAFLASVGIIGLTVFASRHKKR